MCLSIAFMERANITFYGPGEGYQAKTPERALKLVVATSIRDTGASDMNGGLVSVRGGGLRYMEGGIERVVRESMPGGRQDGLVKVAAVITDDMPKDLRGSSYRAQPQRGAEWIFPYDLPADDGSLLIDRTFNIPSDFRSLPLGAKEERRERKLAFERAILEKTEEVGGDVILSDHLMMLTEHLYRWRPGEVLNIHPAVTKEGHEFAFPGKTPTADAIKRAREGHDVRTGATLHFVGPEIDTGPIIAYIAETPVYADDEPQWLRHRNYKKGKLPVLVEGLAHYVQEIHPNLGRIDLDNMQQVLRPEVLQRGRGERREALLFG